MPIRVKCPNCGRPQRIPEGEMGHLFLCPACGNPFRVGEPTPAAAPQPQAVLPVEEVQTAEPSRPWGATQWLSALGICLGVLALVIVAMLIAHGGRRRGSAASSAPPSLSSQNFAAAPMPGGAAPSTSQPWWTASATQPTTSPTTQEASAGPTTAATETPPAFAAATQPTTMATTRPSANPQWPIVALASQSVPPGDQLDNQIGTAISRGITFLLKQFKDGKLRPDAAQTGDSDMLNGEDALAVYALLQAGAASDDPRIAAHAPAIDAMLNVLKDMPMQRSIATYSRSLRAQALGVYNRGEDRSTLRADAAWLLRAAVDGSYSYIMPEPSERNPRFFWDNSNSQYGVLGVWAAAEVNVEVPDSYWSQVQRHWLECQNPDGTWGYTRSSLEGRLSMNVAGITTLLVAQDQLNFHSDVEDLGRPAYSPAISKALAWLESGDNSVTLGGYLPSYNLYGLERAALASGFKYFGTHDWYRELAREALGGQANDGSWLIGGQFQTDPVIDTSLTLLFLSRGRHPLFMNKLRFDGAWANRPRDIANLARYASEQLERPLNWQVVSLSSDWTDWMDAPVLFIASHLPVPLTDTDYVKLRQYAEHGGLIFTHADGDSEAFNKFVDDLAKRLFPQYPLTDLNVQTSPVYQSLFPLNRPQQDVDAQASTDAAPVPPLRGISNGSRLLLVHSPTDLNRQWQLRNDQLHPEAFELGLNVFIYAAGKSNFRYKLKTPLVPPPPNVPTATIPVVRLKYQGNWNPEPAALERLARLTQDRSGVAVNPSVIDFADLKPADAPLALLTGTASAPFTDAQATALHDYVNAGGVVLIDACGGSPRFTQSVLSDLLPRAFPNVTPTPVPAEDPLLKGNEPGLVPVQLKLRPHAAEVAGSASVTLQSLQVGRGFVFFSPVDITTALLGTNTYGIDGLLPEPAAELATNLVIWSVNRPAPQ